MVGRAPEVLAVIPARGGSKGLPGKNIRTFAGIPLIAHSILFGRMCPEIDRLIVSTDSPEIQAVAQKFEGEVPFMRPESLAQDDTAMMPVLQHALSSIEQDENTSFEYVVLLDPTSPAREPSDLAEALRRLKSTPAADGIVSVSRPDFNPVWNCVVERAGWMENLFETADDLARRQDAPAIYRINGALYIWRASFIRRTGPAWRRDAHHLIFEIPEMRAMSIDTLEEFTRAEVLVRAGLIHFAWLDDR